MEEERREQEGRAGGRWLKMLGRKEDGGGAKAVKLKLEEEVGARHMVDVADKMMELADIGEEDVDEGKDDKHETSCNPNGVGSEERKLEDTDDRADPPMSTPERCDVLGDDEESTQNITNNNLEKEAMEHIEKQTQENVLLNMTKEMETEKKSITSVFGRFIRRLNTEPEQPETVQPPTYSEVVQEEKATGQEEKATEEEENAPKEEDKASKEEDLNPPAVEERRDTTIQVDAETQVKEEDFAETEEPVNETLMISERIVENESPENVTETEVPDVPENREKEPESKFRFRFQQFFGDKN